MLTTQVCHALAHDGNVLDQLHIVLDKKMFREQQFRIFGSTLPGTTLYKLRWARLLSAALGFWLLLYDPGSGIALLSRTFQEGISKVHLSIYLSIYL